MKKIMLTIHDEAKAEALLTLLKELPFIETQAEEEKVNDGAFRLLDQPINNPDFIYYKRNELYDR